MTADNRRTSVFILPRLISFLIKQLPDCVISIFTGFKHNGRRKSFSSIEKGIARDETLFSEPLSRYSGKVLFFEMNGVLRGCVTERAAAECQPASCASCYFLRLPLAKVMHSDVVGGGLRRNTARKVIVTWRGGRIFFSRTLAAHNRYERVLWRLLIWVLTGKCFYKTKGKNVFENRAEVCVKQGFSSSCIYWPTPWLLSANNFLTQLPCFT